MIDKYSKEWKVIETAIETRLKALTKSLRIGNKQNQYQDICDRYETIGAITQLEWILRLPEEGEQ